MKKLICLVGILASCAEAQTFNPRGTWASATAYAAGDVVTNSGNTYLADHPFTSGSSFDGVCALPASPPTGWSSDWPCWQLITASGITSIPKGGMLATYYQVMPLINQNLWWLSNHNSGAGPGFSAYNSTQQNAGGGNPLLLAFDTNDWIDSAGLHSTSSTGGAYTKGVATAAGHYLVTCIVSDTNQSSSGGDLLVSIYVNGSQVRPWFGSWNSHSNSPVATDVLNLGLNDYVQCYAYAPGGATVGSAAGAAGTRFTMVKLY